MLYIEVRRELVQIQPRLRSNQPEKKRHRPRVNLHVTDLPVRHFMQPSPNEGKTPQLTVETLNYRQSNSSRLAGEHLWLNSPLTLEFWSTLCHAQFECVTIMKVPIRNLSTSYMYYILDVYP